MSSSGERLFPHKTPEGKKKKEERDSEEGGGRLGSTPSRSIYASKAKKAGKVLFASFFFDVSLIRILNRTVDEKLGDSTGVNYPPHSCMLVLYSTHNRKKKVFARQRLSWLFFFSVQVDP